MPKIINFSYILLLANFTSNINVYLFHVEGKLDGEYFKITLE